MIDISQPAGNNLQKTTKKPPKIILQSSAAMKTIICLVLCALVATTYAAPARSNINQAEAQFWGTLLKGALKLAPHIIRGISGGVEVQDSNDGDENDDDLVNIETLLSQSASLQDRAEIEGFLKVLKKIGKGALKVVPHVIRGLGHGAEGALNLLPNVIGGVEEQDDDDTDIQAVLSSLQNIDEDAQVNALFQSLQLHDRAKMENFWKTLGGIGKGILSVFGKKK